MKSKEKDNSGMSIDFVILIAVLIYFIYVMIS